MAFVTKMSEKRKSTSPSAIQVQNQLREIRHNESAWKKVNRLLTYAIMLDLLIVSICTTRFNADRIKEHAKSGTKVFMWQKYHSHIGMNIFKKCGCESLAFFAWELNK